MKKLALGLSIVMLAACGESKVTRVDGTSVTTANSTLRLIEKGLNLNENDQIAYEVDVQMLHYRYQGMDFAKVLDGKDIDGVRAQVADTKAYFLDINRKRFVASEQVEIDRLTDKVARITELRKQTDASFDPETSIWTSEDLSRIKHAKERQQIYLSQDGDEFWKEHGCGCETSVYDKKVKVL